MTTQDDTQDAARPDHNIWAAVFAEDPLALRTWLSELGFAEGILVPGDEPDTVRHSEMLWPEGGRVMVSSRAGAPAMYEGAGRANLYVVCDDPDGVHGRAVALGAEMTRPLDEQADYTSRGFSCRDAEGNHWSFGTYAG